MVKRLGINQGGYFGERSDICEVLDRTLASAKTRGWHQQQVLVNSERPLWFLHRPAHLRNRTAGARPPSVYLSTGIHGDEPAGPLAVLELVDKELLPEDLDVWLCPCLNPAGCAAGQRENPEGIDLNRDYRHLRSAEVQGHVRWLESLPNLDLTLLLHEDWEAHGFYVYELNRTEFRGISESIVEAVRPVCPIEQSPTVDGRPMAAPGIILPETDPIMRPEWPEAFWLYQKKTALSYTLESPSDFALSVRVSALVRAVGAAIQTFKVRNPGFAEEGVGWS